MCLFNPLKDVTNTIQSPLVAHLVRVDEFAHVDMIFRDAL